MSIILAKIIGLYFIAMGIAFLSNPARLRRMYPQIMNDENFLLLGGMFALLFGAFIVSVHNIWVWEWPVIITILGWWSLIKGFVLLINPASVKFFSFFQERSNLFYRSISLFYLILGLFLAYKGWM